MEQEQINLFPIDKAPDMDKDVALHWQREGLWPETSLTGAKRRSGDRFQTSGSNA